MTVWDSADVADHEQFGFWHEVICRAFVPLTPVRTQPDPGFSSRVETRPLGPVTRARLSSQAQHTRHGPREVAATTEACFFVNLQLRGRCRVRVDDLECEVGPGEFVVVDTVRPYWFDMDQPWEMLSYRVPHAAFAALGIAPPITGNAVPGRGPGGVVSAMMTALWDAGDPAAGDVADGLGHAFVGAVGATVPRERTTSARLALHTAVTAYARRNLTGTDLGVDAVCRHFAVSRRTLHNAFAAAGPVTYAATVRSLRMDRCADLLADPACRATVSQLAAAHGFLDATSFSRAFRRRFGTSPREVRAQACTNGTESVH